MSAMADEPPPRLLSVSESERLLILNEAKRLSREARWLLVSARGVRWERQTDLYIDASDSCMDQASRWQEQLKRPRGRPGHSAR